MVREAKSRRPRIESRPTRPMDSGRLLELVEDLDWYALRVAPQKEFVVQEILTRKGVATYCPSDKRWRRQNRYTKNKDLKSFPLMPSYVFAGFIPGIPSLYDLRKVDAILGCIGFNGEPKRIPKVGIRSMIGRYKNGLQRPTDERFMQTYKEFKAGDLVRIAHGPFEDPDGAGDRNPWDRRREY